LDRLFYPGVLVRMLNNGHAHVDLLEGGSADVFVSELHLLPRLAVGQRVLALPTGTEYAN
jgi:hypothetical protein